MNKTNILFLLKGLEIGGLEVVTAVLANKFVEEDIKLAYSPSLVVSILLLRDLINELNYISRMIILRARRMFLS